MFTAAAFNRQGVGGTLAEGIADPATRRRAGVDDPVRVASVSKLVAAIGIMRLVGATNWFIRWPFVIEGVILGAMGGVLAVLLLLVGKVALIDPLAKPRPATPEDVPAVLPMVRG